MNRQLRVLVVAAIPALLLVLSQPATADPAAPSAADKAYQTALEKARTGNYSEALKVLEPYRKDASASPKMLSLLGTMYLETGHAPEALSVLAPIADTATAEPAVLYNAGRAALATGDSKRAEAYFVRSMKGAPQGSPAMRELGMLYAQQGKVVEAYMLLAPYAVAYPDESEPRMMAALMALRIGRPGEAERLVNGMNPGAPGVQLLRGEIAVAAGDGKGALEILLPLLEKHSPAMDVDLRKSVAEAYLLAGDPKSALAIVKPATTPTLTLLLATAQRQSGNPGEALTTLKPLVDKLPDGPRGLPDPRVGSAVALEYARSLSATGGLLAALPYFEKATRINALSRPAWQALADAYAKAGRKEDAAAASAKAEALNRPKPAAPVQ